MSDTITFADFVTEQNAIIWADGTPENLVGSIRQKYVDAFIDLQRAVDCLQQGHTDIFPFSATYFKCGLSVFDAPRGRIQRVTVVQSENYCDPISYHPRTFTELACWSRGFMDLVDAPANTGLPALPLGFRYPEKSTDSRWGRALRGLWANERGKIYIAPWLQSAEAVIVEWDGLKRKYADTDLVPDEDDLKRAVRLWVQKEHARDFEHDLAAQAAFERDYVAARSDLMWECEQEKKLPKDVVCEAEVDFVSRNQGEDDQTTDTDVSTESQTLFAVIGDYGTPGTPADEVAALVKSWGPEFVVTTGDNNYPAGEEGTIDLAIGKNWRSFIYLYAGAQPLGSGESDATENKFFPVLGNHDLDNATGDPGDPYFAYFDLGLNERYYDFVWGHCHFFMLNSGLKTDGTLVEPDGNDVFSIQMEWLQMRVMQSTARWKIGVIHQGPHQSDTTHGPGLVAARANYKAMGLHLLFSGHGHCYERLEVGGFPYIVNGAGGTSLYAFGSPVSGSKVRYSDDYGAQRVIATCDELKAEFFNRAGDLIDTLTL